MQDAGARTRINDFIGGEMSGLWSWSDLSVRVMRVLSVPYLSTYIITLYRVLCTYGTNAPMTRRAHSFFEC